jgi:hypothetical protein
MYRMSNITNFKNYFKNNLNKFIYFIIIFYLFLITYYNYFSVQFFIWDDKDVIWRIEEIGYSEFFKDYNWSPRLLEKYVWGSMYFLFQYKYGFYTLSFLIIHLLNTFTFYKILKFFIKNKNFISLIIIFYLTYGAHDVVNTKIIFFPKTLYLLIFLISIYMTFKALENLSIIKKTSLILMSIFLMIFVHLSSFPYFIFAEVVRFFGIAYILIKLNKNISLNKIIKNYSLYLIIFLAILIWIGFYENNFLEKKNIDSDYDISKYIKGLSANPISYLNYIFLNSIENFIKLSLSPFFTFFSGINNYIDHPISNSQTFSLSIKVCFYFLTIIYLFSLLENKGIFSDNFSSKKLIFIILLCIIFSFFFLLLSSITGRKINFIFLGGLSRYAYPVSLIYSILFVSLVFLICKNKKLRFFFFSLIISINCFNGFLGSEYYNELENQSKRQFSEIIWRFGDFKNPTNFFLQDNKLSLATALQKDKDHFLLNLLFDKPKEYLNLKRFDNNLIKNDAYVPEFSISVDNFKTNSQRKNIVGFISKTEKCYEFYDINSSPNHLSSLQYTLAEPLDENNIKYDFIRSQMVYKKYKYYDDFNKMKVIVLNDNKETLVRDPCYIYQTLKKYLAIKDYKNLVLLTEKALLNNHYFNDFYNHGSEEHVNLYLWKPLIIGTIIYQGENKSKLLEILKNIEDQPKFSKFEKFREEANQYVIANNLN